LLGYKKQFSIFDSADTGKIISELLGSPDKQEIRTAQSVMSNWKAAFPHPGTGGKSGRERRAAAPRPALRALSGNLARLPVGGLRRSHPFAGGFVQNK
jgi:hypothetical protein